jgi:hypothetical protein
VEVRAEHPAVIGVDAVAFTSRASSHTDTVPSPPSQGCAACGRDRARCSCSQVVADLHGRPASDDVVHTALRPGDAAPSAVAVSAGRGSRAPTGWRSSLRRRRRPPV